MLALQRIITREHTADRNSIDIRGKELTSGGMILSEDGRSGDSETGSAVSHVLTPSPKYVLLYCLHIVSFSSPSFYLFIIHFLAIFFFSATIFLLTNSFYS
jgi:hypothetical protein